MSDSVIGTARHGWGPTRWRAVILTTLLWLMAVWAIVGCARAYARDGWEDRPRVCDQAVITDPTRLARCQQWIEDVKQPDNREISCCADADAYITDDFETIGDQLFAKTTVAYPGVPKGTLIPIPKNKMNRASEDGGNPSGHSVTFILGAPGDGQVLCYFGPTLS